MAKAAAKKVAAKSPTKTEITQNIAAATELTKKQVVAVLEALTEEIRKSLSNRGSGVFTLPGLLKVEKKRVPARPAQKGVLNRFTGELQDRPAKPAYNKVKVRALRALKDFAK
jgi:nucleoid DNA-binding protein